MITEKDLLELGFTRKDVSIEESGDIAPYYYYTKDFGNYLSLISNEINTDGNITISIFDSDIYTSDLQALTELCNVLSKFN